MNPIPGELLTLGIPLLALLLLIAGCAVLVCGRRDHLREQHDTWDMAMGWGSYDRTREV